MCPDYLNKACVKPAVVVPDENAITYVYNKTPWRGWVTAPVCFTVQYHLKNMNNILIYHFKFDKAICKRCDKMCKENLKSIKNSFLFHDNKVKNIIATMRKHWLKFCTNILFGLFKTSNYYLRKPSSLILTGTHTRVEVSACLNETFVFDFLP